MNRRDEEAIRKELANLNAELAGLSRGQPRPLPISIDGPTPLDRYQTVATKP